jgi:hypothetical protein
MEGYMFDLVMVCGLIFSNLVGWLGVGLLIFMGVAWAAYFRQPLPSTDVAWFQKIVLTFFSICGILSLTNSVENPTGSAESAKTFLGIAIALSFMLLFIGYLIGLWKVPNRRPPVEISPD